MNTIKTTECSIVASVFNEHEGIEAFYKELSATMETLQISYEILFVNDGSRDNSLELLKAIAENDAHVKVIDFSRNYGHEAAMIAGIDHSAGNFVICMDSDLQHPPVSISQIKEKMDEGYDVVTMVRKKREDASAFQEFRSRTFYKILNKMSDVTLDENASDFFAISKKVVAILQTDYRERTRFLRGIIQTVGFKKTSIEYVAQKRFAGKSNYSFFKLLKLSLAAISSFSKLPLQIGVVTGLFFMFASVILLIYSLIMWILNTPISGYTTLVVALCAFAGIQLFVMGIIGIYISYIFDEIKGRPIYLVNTVISKSTENEEK